MATFVATYSAQAVVVVLVVVIEKEMDIWLLDAVRAKTNAKG